MWGWGYREPNRNIFYQIVGWLYEHGPATRPEIARGLRVSTRDVNRVVTPSPSATRGVRERAENTFGQVPGSPPRGKGSHIDPAVFDLIDRIPPLL